MKHENMGFVTGLPDAPLAMPKQVLERRRGSMFVALRAMLASFPRFTA
jgi:hypothetical protein